jgi:hypothetical protein
MKNLANLAKKYSKSFLSEVFRLNLLQNWLCIFRSKNTRPIGIWQRGNWFAGFGLKIICLTGIWIEGILLMAFNERYFADGHLMRGILLIGI